jgi:hypothetical protein
MEGIFVDFQKNGATLLSVDASGRVGIGITGMTWALQIQAKDAAVVQFADENGAARFQFFSDGSTFWQAIPATALVTARSSSALFFSTSRWDGAAAQVEYYGLRAVRGGASVGDFYGQFVNHLGTVGWAQSGLGGLLAVGYDFPHSSNLTTLGQFHARARDDTYPAATFQANSATQSANLSAWRDGAGNVNAYVSNIAAGAFKPRDGGTNSLTTVILLGHNSSGTPAAGFGNEIRFQLKSSTTEDQDAAGIRVGWQTATHASRAASGAIDAYYTTTARECLNWAADSSAARIGFLGAAHQPRTSAYTPTNVTTDRSYDANATTVDEIADVLGTLIADLQAFGLLG